MPDEIDGTTKHNGFFEGMARSYERDAFLEGLREREQRILDAYGDCRCAAAPLCGMHRRPGELFSGGLPESVELP